MIDLAEESLPEQVLNHSEGMSRGSKIAVYFVLAHALH